MKKYIVPLTCMLAPIGIASASADYITDFYNGNYHKATISLEELVSQHDKQAMYYLGKIYLSGYGGAKKYKHGFDLITESGNLGYEPAQVYLAKHYLNLKKGAPQALAWFQKAADKGNVESQLYCGYAYLNGYGVAKNKEQAIFWLEKAAQNKAPKAQYELASLYLKSNDETKRLDALQWLEKAAASGDKQSQYTLGKIYSTGEFVQQDNAAAIKWMENAITGKTASAIANKAKIDLAMLYLITHSSEVNSQKAISWLTEAANTGDAESQYNLGRLYEGNLGIKPDLNKAYDWYLKSANQNNKKSQQALAQLLLNKNNQGNHSPQSAPSGRFAVVKLLERKFL